MASEPWMESDLETIQRLEEKVATLTKELAHWKAGHLDSHAAEVATLRAALAAAQARIEKLE